MDDIRFEQSLQKLPTPTNYHIGLHHQNIPLANDILLFHRTRLKNMETTRSHHHRFMLIINFKTKGHLFIDEKPFFFNPNQALFIFPHQFHYYRHLESDHISWLFITFTMKDSHLLHFCKECPMNLTKQHFTLLRQILDTYTNYVNTSDENRIISLTLLLGLLLTELAKLGYVSKQPIPEHATIGQKPSKIQKINKYIHEHFHNSLPLHKIAQAFCLSDSQLRKMYREETGISIGKYIKEMRMLKASKLLLQSNLNITHVAAECGYDSVYSFSRAFKNKMNISPLKYRHVYSKDHL